MRFAHLADCHIGSWRDPKLKDAAVKAFSKAIDICIEKQVDFILIAGDLFNTSLPAIESLKQTVQKLKELEKKNIPVYIIAGSHDFSPSGKTMLDVLEEAGLLMNIVSGKQSDEKLLLNFNIDKKTGAKIAGLLGKRSGLEKEFYEVLDRQKMENEPGYKIFMFHSLLTELKPQNYENIDSHPLSLLPKKFNYYAGGHPHFVLNKSELDYGIIAYPGPLFPNNFKELEELERGGFFIVEFENGQTKAEFQPVQIYNVFQIFIDAEHKAPEQVEQDIEEKIRNKEFNNTIVTLRIEGMLSRGKPSDINLKEIFEKFYKKSAYLVMKNTSKLTSQEFEEIKIQDSSSVELIESKLIKEHLQQIKVENLNAEKEELLVKELMQSLSTEKSEGETSVTFENRLKSEINIILGL